MIPELVLVLFGCMAAFTLALVGPTMIRLAEGLARRLARFAYARVSLHSLLSDNVPRGRAIAHFYFWAHMHRYRRIYGIVATEVEKAINNVGEESIHAGRDIWGRIDMVELVLPNLLVYSRFLDSLPATSRASFERFVKVSIAIGAV